ncbi:MAG: radical SAM protein [Betaproteobacteria bacterium]|nr:radical SAM protein [Betaproteobacteria bacterium]
MSVPTIEQRMEAAMRHQGEGRLAEADALYSAILAQDARQGNARHNLGIVRLGQGQFASALELLGESFAQDGGNRGWVQSLPVIGMTLYQQGRWEAAATWLERAVVAGVRDPQVVAARERCAPRDYLAPEVFDAQLGRVLRRHSPRESPTYVYAIDVVGTCNLRCPTCPVGNSPLGGRPRGFMEVDLFRRIIEKVTSECAAPRPEIFLFNWGEPLLHPRIGEILRIVHEAGLPSHLSTNLNIEGGFREVAKANPTNLKISLSGFTPETYERTHAKGDLTLVKSNLYRLRHDLEKYKATTRVWVGHHLYRGNAGQVDQVAAVCRELGFEHHPIAAFFQPLERLIEVVEGRGTAHPILDELLEHPRTYVPRIKASKSGSHDCELRFNQTAINFDGTVALCCSVYDEANMLGATFLDHSHAELEAMKYAHPFCRTCHSHGLHYAPGDASGDAPLS